MTYLVMFFEEFGGTLFLESKGNLRMHIFLMTMTMKNSWKMSGILLLEGFQSEEPTTTISPRLLYDKDVYVESFNLKIF